MLYLKKLFVLNLVLYVTSSPNSEQSDVNGLIQRLSRYFYKIDNEERVRLDIYYEALCPDCIAEYPHVLEVSQKLGNHVNLHTYPYGNARTHTENGKKVVVCQHGEAECYGNKLHACAIDILKNTAAWVKFNACMMANGSDDNAAQQCSLSQNVDVEPIINCAEGKRGQALLIYYGEQSEPLHYLGVPYVLVNGISKSDQQPLWDAVCKAFKNPPKQCRE